MRQWVKIIAINFAILIGLLFAINMFSAVVVKYHNVVERWLTPQPGAEVMEPGETHASNPIATNHMNRWRLPNYTNNRQEAYNFFTEFEQIKSEYRAFVGWSRQPFNGKTTTINAAGDRTHTPPQKTPENATTIRFFGGSTMWGLGTANQGTIPAQFNRMLPHTKVFNHGEASFTSRQNLARLSNLFSAGQQADYVVFFNGHNHLSTACGEGRKFNRGTQNFMHHYRESQIQGMVSNASAYGNPLAGAFWQYTASLIPQVIYRLNPALTEAQTTQWDTNPKKAAEECADILINNWRMAHAIAKENNARFIAVLQPTSSEGQGRTDHLMPSVLTPAKKALRFKEYYAAMREKMAEYDYMHDLSSAFDGEEYIYVDAVHASANGNMIIAQKIKEILFPPPPPLEEKILTPEDKPGENLPAPEAPEEK